MNLRSGGTIGQRVHINVDYDTERDFTANNNIQVYYQGLEDEIIRRIEVGTVTFQPPQSRFITAAIPANNFGVNARFDVGAFQFQALAATQKGSQVAERVYTVGQTTSQPQDRQLRDLDFETGRFFWVVDPTTALPGYPGIDILNLCGRHAWRRLTGRPRFGYIATGRPRVRAAPIPISAALPRSAATIDPAPELRTGSVAASGSGHRLLPRSLGALVCAGHQAGPERLPGSELYHRGRHHRRKLSRRRTGVRVPAIVCG